MHKIYVVSLIHSPRLANVPFIFNRRDGETCTHREVEKNLSFVQGSTFKAQCQLHPLATAWVIPAHRMMPFNMVTTLIAINEIQ